VLNVSKLKILVPLDNTEKSMHSLNWLKKFFSGEEVDVTLLNVVEVFYKEEMFSLGELETVKEISKQVLDAAEKELGGYKVTKLGIPGYGPDVILKEASEGKYDMIVMTKSSVKGISRIIGSVTNKVVRNSEVAVVVVPE
jgi:nucleotide-binding universal stress UspA family protein